MAGRPRSPWARSRRRSRPQACRSPSWSSVVVAASQNRFLPNARTETRRRLSLERAEPIRKRDEAAKKASRGESDDQPGKSKIVLSATVAAGEDICRVLERSAAEALVAAEYQPDTDKDIALGDLDGSADADEAHGVDTDAAVADIAEAAALPHVDSKYANEVPSATAEARNDTEGLYATEALNGDDDTTVSAEGLISATAGPSTADTDTCSQGANADADATSIDRSRVLAASTAEGHNANADATSDRRRVLTASTAEGPSAHTATGDRRRVLTNSTADVVIDIGTQNEKPIVDGDGEVADDEGATAEAVDAEAIDVETDGAKVADIKAAEVARSPGFGQSAQGEEQRPIVIDGKPSMDFVPQMIQDEAKLNENVDIAREDLIVQTNGGAPERAKVMFEGNLALNKLAEGDVSRKCFRCDATATYQTAPRRFKCTACIRPYVKTCHKCHEDIFTLNSGVILKSGERYTWHTRCFTCPGCAMPNPIGHLWVIQGRVYCPVCAERAYLSGERWEVDATNWPRTRRLAFNLKNRIKKICLRCIWL